MLLRYILGGTSMSSQMRCLGSILLDLCLPALSLTALCLLALSLTALCLPALSLMALFLPALSLTALCLPASSLLEAYLQYLLNSPLLCQFRQHKIG